MPEKPALTSSELGTLWLTYQQKTMILRMLEYFIEKADDEKAKNIMVGLYDEIDPYVEKITVIFQNEGAAIPVGFTSQDVNKDVPKLYDHGFDIIFVRLIKEISMGMHTLNITMASREDIVMMFKDLTAITQKYYNACTQYLIEKGMLARPPYVSMPQSVEFVKDTSYLGGLNPLGSKRTLNTVEVANMFHAIETNITGMQMITGFAQCANEQEAKKYFSKGSELAKSIVEELSKIFLQDGIQTPSASGGIATRSTVAPFSDKLMMYCTSLFCSFSLGGNSLGTAFSLRNDLSAKIMVFMKDVFQYAHEGAKIMIRNGWMEEEPQMEERDKLKK
ncbi:DUF3231 family protein [Halobacillus shinanisalinarum]|uniref:DUF3231 family protein n=1 Tax=Halobacillus shinanisalinarum TaxID=2932258 RepID=A0ABY4GWB6_9BACI|nr:DUF3231 family protein [Halobacillus shinanisalinarum]UOQ92205.1 DUF3231 family protein [Halobacillus shinanisalinarum]